MSNNILQLEENPTLELIQSAVNQLSRKFGPGAFNRPSDIALSPTNYRELYKLPPTMAQPHFEIRAIDVLGLRIIEDSTLPDNELVLMYNKGGNTKIKLIRLVEEPNATTKISQSRQQPRS